MDKLLFARWKLPRPDSTAILEHIGNLPDRSWFYEPYRNTWMLPLVTKGGQTGYHGTSNYNTAGFSWTEYAPANFKEYCEDVLFPALGTKTRLVILKTAPQDKNNEHIDCDPHHQFTRQHKFRLVLRGKTNTLYFIKKNEIVFAPDILDPFIMDGSWPHGMKNFNNETKYTLTAGSPWTGCNYYNNLEILMTRKDEELPIDYEKYYKR